MNSRSRNDDDCDNCKNQRNFGPTIIKCSCPSAITIPNTTPFGTNFTISSLILDTSSLCNPTVKLEFSSNIVAAVAFAGTINFQVFKLCRGQSTSVPVGPVWTFNSAALISSQTFSFFVCDCDSCFNDCCSYTVVATVFVTGVDDDFDDGGSTISINNATLGVIET
ncbi:DUF4489 domain-containing protein [Clostridium saccharoperbutylacetonicum]|uniref:DUF4489 domain-containing protein n=1 Tax=Clostridium saccharoperbutylacetonicum TaxID=36745 RepID=UPI00156FB3CE|nr:DUF4489 domain-containing protein [Clostridium saccharoperbutylacetonicum]NSB30301.1 hypothetical protein [Clostridium saccharoperbutylacetonicum]